LARRRSAVNLPVMGSSLEQGAGALGVQLTERHQTVASYGGVGGGATAMRHGHGGTSDEADSDAERFFRAVDRAIVGHHSRPTKLPLMLASLPEHHVLFHEVSRRRCS